MVFMDGFPHSDIGGSQNICFSPPLFAAYHVLLRLPVPRHPPCALFCLTISTYSVMSDGLFNLSIALVCFCYSLKNNRFDVLIFHQFIFSMQFSRNNSFGLSTSGDNEIRTRDPLLARQVLSQLSYTPINLAVTYLPIPLPI